MVDCGIRQQRYVKHLHLSKFIKKKLSFCKIGISKMNILDDYFIKSLAYIYVFLYFCKNN